MRSIKTIFPRLSVIRRYRFRTIITIAIFWTVTDIIVILTLNSLPVKNIANLLVVREIIVFFMSLLIGYLLVFTLRKYFRNYYLWASLLIKSTILVICAFLMTLLVYAVNSISFLGMPIANAFHAFYGTVFHPALLIQKILYWLILFIVTQLLIEVNEKYSPGVFLDILMGKYKEPKIERRIVMFIDLKDSTPIAEKLGHEQHFKFIREFIYQVSNALIEFGGRIYQYVGDEIVVSWLFNTRNTKKCLKSLIEARKNLQMASEDFRRQFDIAPEFRVGVHIGDVTVGEIGVIKKDIAMSGDTMNTTARIRSACSELNQKFIVSKDFIDNADLKDWQSESLGMVELKGKSNEIELFSLKI